MSGPDSGSTDVVKPAGTLPYRPTQRRPIPVWKHVLFVPLLFWIGLFIVAGVAAVAWEIFEVVWRVVTRSP